MPMGMSKKMSSRTRMTNGIILMIDLSISIAAMFVEALILPAIITTASSLVILGITGLVKLLHLKKATHIAALAEGEKKIMKKKLLPKLKAAAKYIFVSNPATFFCATLAILLLAINGALGGLIANNVLWFTSNELVVNISFNAVVALLGLTGACIAGLESNEQADVRKSQKKCEKAEACREAQIRTRAEQLKQQNEDYNMQNYMSQARYEIECAEQNQGDKQN